VHADPKAPLPVKGSLIDGKYRVEQVLGEGGMGIVFQATHVRLGQGVAIKMLHPAMLSKPEIVERFEREARAAAQLRSPNAVRVVGEKGVEGQSAEGRRLRLHRHEHLVSGRADLVRRRRRLDAEGDGPGDRAIRLRAEAHGHDVGAQQRRHDSHPGRIRAWRRGPFVPPPGPRTKDPMRSNVVTGAPSIFDAMRVFGAAVAVVCVACGGGNAASKLANPPEFQPKDQTRCGVAKSQARPLVVEWPSADRQELESQVRRGVVVVRYEGCEMNILARCSAPASYGYRGTTIAQDKLVIKDADDLYANLPVGATKLEGRLERSGQLTVDMDLVGRYESEKPLVRADELQGDCAGATHFVYGVSVGAFDFYAGGHAQVGGGANAGGFGAGAHSLADREALTRNGDLSACEKATTDDKAPPQGCGAVIRLEVVPLVDATGHAASARTAAPGGPLPSVPGKWRKEDNVYGGPATLTFEPDGSVTYNNPSTTPGHGHWAVSGTTLQFDVNTFSQHMCRALGAALSCHGTNKNGDWAYVLTRGP